MRSANALNWSQSTWKVVRMRPSWITGVRTGWYDSAIRMSCWTCMRKWSREPYENATWCICMSDTLWTQASPSCATWIDGMCTETLKSWEWTWTWHRMKLRCMPSGTLMNTYGCMVVSGAKLWWFNDRKFYVRIPIEFMIIHIVAAQVIYLVTKSSTMMLWVHNGCKTTCDVYSGWLHCTHTRASVPTRKWSCKTKVLWVVT